MSTETGKSGNILATVAKYATIFFLNAGRRLVLAGRGLLLWWQGRRYRKACQVLGRQVMDSLEAGEVNPLLTEAVKDSIDRARAVKAVQDRCAGAAAALRQKMAEAWASLKE